MVEEGPGHFPQFMLLESLFIEMCSLHFSRAFLTTGCRISGVTSMFSAGEGDQKFCMVSWHLKVSVWRGLQKYAEVLVLLSLIVPSSKHNLWIELGLCEFSIKLYCDTKKIL